MVSLRDLSALSASAVISLAGNSNIFMHLGAPPAHERLNGNEPGLSILEVNQALTGNESGILFENEEILSPAAAGSGRFLIPTPPSPHVKKKRGAQMGLSAAADQPFGPMTRYDPGIFLELDQFLGGNESHIPSEDSSSFTIIYRPQ
jgi:hypothetical protein